MSRRRLPGVYTERERTNPASRRVPALATGVMVIDSHKGELNQRDIVTSEAEFIAKYGDKESAPNKLDHLAALAFLKQGKALYLTRVRAADTSSRAALQVDSGDDGLPVDTGVAATNDAWVETSYGTDWRIGNVGYIDYNNRRYCSNYLSQVNQSKLQLQLDQNSEFASVRKMKIKLFHDVGFPVKLIITDSSNNSHTLEGYISEAEIDLRLTDLNLNDRWLLELSVSGEIDYCVSHVGFFVYGPEVSGITGGAGRTW